VDREAKAISALQHANITLYDIGSQARAQISW